MHADDFGSGGWASDFGARRSLRPKKDGCISIIQISDYFVFLENSHGVGVFSDRCSEYWSYCGYCDVTAWICTAIRILAIRELGICYGGDGGGRRY